MLYVAQEVPVKGVPRNNGIDHGGGGEWQGHHEQKTIEQTDVVGNDEGLAVGAHGFQCGGIETVKKAQQEQNQGAEQGHGEVS